MKQMLIDSGFARWRAALLVFLFIGGIAVPLFSQTESRVTAVRVTGLKRTKPRTAEEPLRRFIGQEASTLDPDQVKAVVLDQGILEPISVTITDEAGGPGKTLLVEVREKWTIFPIPVFFAGSGGISAGLALFDANAFGLNHKMAVTGMWQSDSWMAMAMYAVPPGGPGRFGWGATGFFSEGEQRYSDARDKTLRRFNTYSIAAGFSPQYQINHSLSAALRVFYTNTLLRDDENPVNPPDSGAQFIQLGPELSVRRTGWDGYLLSEESASVRYVLFQDLASPVWHSLSVQGVYEKPLVPGFRVSLRGGGLFRPDAPELLESGPNEASVTILPGSFSARHYAGLSAGLEKTLHRFSFGTVSLLGAWQMAYSSGPVLGSRFDYGAAGSLRLYLSRLAIPAMGLGVSYNIPADYFQFSFSIGMTL
jgi:hypothetical protein